MNDERIKELEVKVDNLTKEISELKSAIVMLVNKPNIPQGINYTILLESAIFSYIIYSTLDYITGKGGGVDNLF